MRAMHKIPRISKTGARASYLAAGIAGIAASMLLAAALFSTGYSPAWAGEARNADELLIIDCLLPGQVRKLGRRLKFLTPRRPARTTQRDCEIRGGEYVSYDRADYATSLKIWLPLAQEGDPKAQTYVGEMSEKGLGQAPDYEMAALWYRRAAKQGYAPAQLNFGQLYEKGLGVEKDMQTAVMWYRRAAGLDDAGIQAVVFGDATAEIEKLQTALNVRSQEVATLRAELKTLDRELEGAWSERRKVDAEMAAQRRALEEERRSLGKRRQALQAEKEALARARQPAARGHGKKQGVGGGAETMTAKLAAEKARLSRRAKNLADKESALERERRALEDRQKEIQKATSGERKKHSEEDALLKRQFEELAVREAAIRRAEEKLEKEHLKAEAAVAAERERLRNEHAKEKALLDPKIKDVAERETAIARREQEIKERQQKAERAMLAELQERADEIARRERELENRAALFAKRADELKVLNAQIAKLDSKVEKGRLQIASLQQGGDGMPSGASVDGPRIEMIEPRIPKSRGGAVIYTRGGTPVRTIVGRVIAPNGFYRLLINDRAVAVDESSLFQTEIPLVTGGVKVQIVVLDKAGRRGELAFELRQKPKAGPAVVDAKAGSESYESTDVDFGNFHALLIGNHDYKSLPKLDTPKNDVTELAAVLERKYGFKTTVLLDATRYQILSALNKLRSELTENDNLVLYYAGHGVLDTVNQRGHWLPVDAEADNTANWISNVAITDILNTMSVRKIMVVADSCYSGTLTRSTLARLDAGQSPEAWKAWLELMATKKSRTALTSGGIAPVLDGGGGRFSIFAKALIYALRKNPKMIDGRTLHQIVAQAVSYAAGAVRFEQIPQYSPIKYAGHEAGDFFFVPRT